MRHKIDLKDAIEVIKTDGWNEVVKTNLTNSIIKGVGLISKARIAEDNY